MQRYLIAAIAALACVSCSQAAGDTTPEPRPTPTPKAIVDSDTSSDWRIVPAEDLLVIKTRFGDIFVELNAEFAPGHVKRIRDLAAKRALNGAEFYRVIDGFVAQGGLQAESDWTPLENENERPFTASDAFTPLGNADLFASEIGFAHGFPVARNPETGMQWLTHCPGAMAMARDTDPNSGLTEFYIVLDAQRYLDRNLTVFGRVIKGMDIVQKLTRGDKDVAGGVIQPPTKPDKMFSFLMASDISEAERPILEVMKTDSSAFARALDGQRIRKDPFFYNTPPEVVDLCDADIPVRQIK